MLAAAADGDEWIPGPEEQWLVDAKFEADKDGSTCASNICSTGKRKVSRGVPGSRLPGIP